MYNAIHQARKKERELLPQPFITTTCTAIAISETGDPPIGRKNAYIIYQFQKIFLLTKP